MRGVFVFPLADQDHVRQQIGPASTEHISLSIQTTAEPDRLFSDWEPSGLAKLEAALGRVPDWCVTCDVSGRIAGDAEVRAVTLDLLADGGVAVDDYSEHCWTAAEIAEGRRVDGLSFFDYTTSAARE